MVIATDDDDDSFDSFDEFGVCRDGRGIGVSALLMDSRRFTRLTDEQARRFQPGFRCADADPGAKANAGARETYLRELQTAWKNQPSGHAEWTASRSDVELAEKVAAILRLSRPVATSSGPPFTPNRGSDARSDARNLYVRNLTNAWRDAAQPDLGSRLEELRRHQEEPDKADPNAAAERARELENWRGRDLSELAAAVETRRKAAHLARTKTLENAWRAGK